MLVMGARGATGYVLGRGAGASNWWEAGGATGIVAAYQPKGAASLAASYVNLANPGTYDAAPGVAPAWDAASGWKRIASSGTLDSGVTPTSSAWTMIMRFSNYAYTNGAYRYIGLSGKNFAFSMEEAANQWGFYNHGGLLKSGQLSSGVLAIAGQTGYRDGVAQGTIPSAWTGSVTGSIYLLSCYGLPSNAPTQIYVQAFAIYSATLSAAQVAAVTAAMNLL